MKGSPRRHPTRPAVRNGDMAAGFILVLVLAVPYLTLNLWRLARGRSWALTFCHVMREWEAGERVRHAAARAGRQGSRSSVDAIGELSAPAQGERRYPTLLS